MSKRRLSSPPAPVYQPGVLPLVAIVGRPNVGKSTLFNRLSRSRKALVDDRPGVTRDRHYAATETFGRPYFLVDTGGLNVDESTLLHHHINEQIRTAIAEADLLVCVLDARAEPTEADRILMEAARASRKPLIVVANKADAPAHAHEAAAHYELGIDNILPISALHVHGLALLEEMIAGYLPKPNADTDADTTALPRVAVLGRPNAGKSSLTNRLLGEARQVVDDVPGTTTTATETLVTLGGTSMIWIDTAGIRRRRSVERGLESLSVLQAIDVMRRADAVVLLVDGKEGAVEQDAKLAALAADSGRALIVALNKVDLWQGELDATLRTVGDNLSFVEWAPRVRISATHGRGLTRLEATLAKVLGAHARRVSTAELNRFFAAVIEDNPPPVTGGRAPRIYYVTQAATCPPTFVAMTNGPDRIRDSYRRYLVNKLREFFDFEGTPIRIYFRGKSPRAPEP